MIWKEWHAISAFPVTALEYLYYFLWVISWAAISSLKCYSRWFVQKVSEGKYHLLKAYQVSLVLVLFLSLIAWKPVHCVLNHRAVIWRCSNVAYIPLRRKKIKYHKHRSYLQFVQSSSELLTYWRHLTSVYSQ